MGPADFFALEAGEFLERLDALVSQDAPPAGEDFVRLARAVRGSALMAKYAAIARAAAGLEALARAVRDGARAWGLDTRQLAIRAVDDLKIFVRRAANWTNADDAQAEALGQSLEQAAGRRSAPMRAIPETLDAGTRAFVAREGAAIASALDRAAQVLKANPLAHDPLQVVLRAAQPLRGLAALNDLPPLPDLLDGVERAVSFGQQPGFKPAGDYSTLFQAAASAMTKAAREVAERGRPDPEGAEFQRFAQLITGLISSGSDIVPIESLYYDDAGPHLVQRGTPPTRPAVLGRLELVSHGEHLRHAADSLERAPSRAQREIRAHALAGTLRALESAAGGPLADQVGRFATGARDAVSQGTAVAQAPTFAGLLRQVGDILARSASDDEAALAAELDSVLAALRALVTGAPAVPARAPAPAPAPTPAAPPPARAPAPPVPAATAAPSGDDDRPPESADLSGSWVRYQRFIRERGLGPASLQEFMAGVSLDTAAPPPAPTGETAPRPALTQRAPTADSAVVDIRTLVYRGAAARKRMQELRERAKDLHGEALRVILDEVCDLVDLAVDSAG